MTAAAILSIAFDAIKFAREQLREHPEVADAILAKVEELTGLHLTYDWTANTPPPVMLEKMRAIDSGLQREIAIAMTSAKMHDKTKETT